MDYVAANRIASQIMMAFIIIAIILFFVFIGTVATGNPAAKDLGIAFGASVGGVLIMWLLKKYYSVRFDMGEQL